MTLTAGAPLPVLMNALERAGWGDLAGADLRGVRVVLGALSRKAAPVTAIVDTITAEQLAAAAGYSIGWTRTRLHWLEDLGILTWTRGGVVDGRPTPSRMRLDKRALLGLVAIARDLRDVALAALREQTRARIAGLRALDIRSRTHKRRSVHVTLTGTLPPYGEDPDPSPVASTPHRHPISVAEQTRRNAGGLAAVRAAFAAATGRVTDGS